MLKCIIVGFGGFFGAVLRYLIGFLPITDGGFPVKTFLINILGSFAIGAIAALASKNQSLNPYAVLFLKVGICGGFTTFSSFALETCDLIQKDSGVIAAFYVLFSLIFSIAAVFLAEWIFK